MNSKTIPIARFPRRASSLANPLKIVMNLRGRYFSPASSEPHIFVLGAPRSGTTLMFTILSAHPNISSINCETFFFVPRDIFNLSSYKCLADNSSVPLKDIEDCIKSSNNIVEMYDEIAKTVMSNDGGKRFLEKTPFHVLYINFLIKHFPNAKFINMIRDGRDCYSSNKRLAGHHRKTLESTSMVWRDSIRTRQSMEKSPQIIDIRYEDLTSSPEKVVRKLMFFLGEDFFPYQIDLTHQSQSKMFKDAKGHERLNKPIEPTSVGKWRERLTADEIEYFQKVAGKELLAMGYEVADP